VFINAPPAVTEPSKSNGAKPTRHRAGTTRNANRGTHR